MRIVLAADSHLNKTYARMTPDQLQRRRRRMREAWAESVAYAVENQAAAYLHAGDLFDGPNPRSAELTLVATVLSGLATAAIPAFLLPGNHDMPRTRGPEDSPQALLGAVGLAHVFHSRESITWHRLTGPGLTVALGGLAPDGRLGEGADPLAGLAVPAPSADVTLLVSHYGLEGSLPAGGREPVIRRSSVAALAGRVDALVLGHVHEPRIEGIGSVKVIVPGPTERTSFGEMSAQPGFMDLSLTADGITATRVPTGGQSMQRIRLAAEDLPGEDPTAYLAECIRLASDPDKLLQMTLSGSLTRERYREIAFPGLWRVGNELNAYFDLDRHGLAVAGATPATLQPGSARVSPRTAVRQAAAARLLATPDPGTRRTVRAALERVLTELGAGSLVEDTPVALPLWEHATG